MALTMHQQSKKSDEEFSRHLMSRKKQTMGYKPGCEQTQETPGDLGSYTF